MSDEPDAGTRPNEAERVLREEIELRAYFKYRERSCADGCDVDDWLAAEQEILTERAAIPAPRETDMSDSPADASGGEGVTADSPSVRGRERVSNRPTKR
jgi:hypothetical protein